LKGGRVTTITNGFDYEEIALANSESSLKIDRKMHFIHAGSLYSDFNPVFFLECFRSWLERDKIDQGLVKIDFYGTSDQDYGSLVKELGLETVVEFRGFKPRVELLPNLLKADSLLLFLGFENNCKDVIPAKLFDYLAAGGKIIALTPEGESAELIRKFDAGICVTKPDKECVMGAIDRVYRHWIDNSKEKREYRHIEEIDRLKLVSQLAEVLDKAAEKSKSTTP
jgi:glycosyltransferase involved in cell wall biosynthesis